MKRLVTAALVVAWSAAIPAQDASQKGAEVMARAREALGGGKLAQLNTLTLEGPFAREMGQRQVKGTMVLTMQLPDRMHRIEDTEMMGGVSIERTSVLAGDTAWDDMQNRGGMGGGVQMVFRQGPPGQELNAEQIEQARLRRFRSEFNRYLLAFTGGANLEPTYVAVAEAPEGKADVVEVKNEAGQSVRLFVDQQTHLPLMLQYMEVRPRFNIMRGPGGPGGEPRAGSAPADGQRPNPEEMRRSLESMPPPAPSQMTLYLADFKKVDGIMLPHRLTQAADGKPVEEWTLEKVKVNPSVKADLFEKK